MEEAVHWVIPLGDYLAEGPFLSLFSDPGEEQPLAR
jgi:hypothetical protein